ncbi:MAG: hypothetical protein HY730_08160 [Candidatus Tectomicrobia bacterium]|uniref:Uncharacterized protein n=1 Tax=Tectimicrobiota bacterium TaxID=2528274 RepID=A0A933GLX8_UNCTE|nr:hypothetical protein [Candidatus Tectomicrobia bacterium]
MTTKTDLVKNAHISASPPVGMAFYPSVESLQLNGNSNAGKGLKPYADTLTTTLNKWAQAEASTYRVFAEGGIDDQTGLAMVTLNLWH